jgi:hypothetical protein
MFFGTIDWTNAVALPVIIGIPLSLYSAFVATRWMGFKQAKVQAAIEVAQLPMELAKADSFNQGITGLSGFLHAPLALR